MTIDTGPFPVLETKRLVLRKITKEDANSILDSDFEKLQFVKAPQYFLDVVGSSKVDEF